MTMLPPAAILNEILARRRTEGLRVHENTLRDLNAQILKQLRDSRSPGINWDLYPLARDWFAQREGS